MNLKVQKDTCIGCGICSSLCPKVFATVEPDYKAEIIPGSDLGQFEKEIEEAIKSCPTNAIIKE